MKQNHAWTETARQRNRRNYNLFRMPGEPEYAPPPVPKLFIVRIKTWPRYDKKAVYNFLHDDQHAGQYAIEAQGPSTAYFFDEASTAFEFKMRFG